MVNPQFDILCENFDLFFEKELEKITEPQKKLLPEELVYRIINKGGVVHSKSTRKLSFLSKLFILFKALNKRCIIIIEDEEKGVTEEEFFKLKKKIVKHDFGESNASELVTHLTFVLGNKELIDGYHLLSLMSASPAYNYLVRSKNKDYSKGAEWLTAMNYISRFVSNYEANRKRIAMQTGLTMADWLVLIYLYHGNLVKSSAIYKDFYKYSYNSSASKIKGSFRLLQDRKYVEKVGSTKLAKIRITALGRDKVNEVMAKFVVNC